MSSSGGRTSICVVKIWRLAMFAIIVLRSGTIGVFNSACRCPSARKVCWHRICVLASQSADNVVHFGRLCDLSNTVTAVLVAGAPSARRITRKRCLCALDSLPEELAITISAESFRQADGYDGS